MEKKPICVETRKDERSVNRKCLCLCMEMVKLELADLHNDIESLIEHVKTDKKEEHISNYVFWHNLSLFKNEVLGLDEVNKTLNSIDISAFENIENLVLAIKDKIKKRCDEIGSVKALYNSIDRKIDKVVKFLEHK